MSNIKSIVFNLQWYEVLQEYPAEVRLEVYEAIMRYASTGTLPDLKPLANMAFSFIKKELDYNRQKYEATCAKRREAGRKGGEQTQAKKANATAAKQTKQMLAIGSKCKQKGANQANNDNEYDNDIELSSTTSKRGVGEEDHKIIIEEFLSGRSDVEAFCMSNHISPDELRRVAGEILVEWKLTNQTHPTKSDAKRHLINQIRIKLAKKRYDTNPKDRLSKRRGADSAAISPEDYSESI